MDVSVCVCIYIMCVCVCVCVCVCIVCINSFLGWISGIWQKLNQRNFAQICLYIDWYVLLVCNLLILKMNCSNLTTIESKKLQSQYSMGSVTENIKVTFGPSPCTWSQSFTYYIHVCVCVCVCVCACVCVCVFVRLSISPIKSICPFFFQFFF
jgi:hypothetical protein